MSLDAGLIAGLVALIALASALAAAEVSLLRTQRVSVEVEATGGREGAGAVLRLLDDLPVALNTVLLAALFTQVSAASIGSFLAQRWFGGAAGIATATIMTVVLFIYTEAIPKTLALRFPVRTSRTLARPLELVVRVIRPLTAVLLAIADAQTPGKGATANAAFTEDELRLLAEESARAGEIEREDAALVNRSFEFGDRRIGEILVPVERVVAISATTTPADALSKAVASGHRRIPVFQDDIRFITGVVRLRDLATADSDDVADLVRPVSRTRSEVRISDVLAGMQQTGRRLAVVEDANGETEGIVTIEDIVAELVGEIEEPD